MLDVVVASLLLVDKGSLDIIPELAVLGDAAACCGLVFSSPCISAPRCEGDEVFMGEDSGMEMSLRRPPLPLCEPAPGLLEESRTLISWALGAGGGSLATSEEFAAGGEILLFEIDAPVACPVTMPVVDCSVDWLAIGRLFWGVDCRFWCFSRG